MSNTLNTIYRSIPNSLSNQGLCELFYWRNKAATEGRKVVTGVALLPIGIISIVEATMSFALSILTAPAEIVGIQFSRNFLRRSKDGWLAASQSLILFPIPNIFKKQLSANPKPIYSPFHVGALGSLAKWRFRAKPGLDTGMRMAATGVGITILGVLGYLETIMSLALGILTAPAAIVGSTPYSQMFFQRAHIGAIMSSYALTSFHLANFNIQVSKPNIPEYKSLRRVYNVIKTPLSQRAAQPLKKWRNQGAPGMDKTARTIVRGVALGALEITSLIESIASIALGLLTTPAEIVGIRFSTFFFDRAHTLLRFRRLVD